MKTLSAAALALGVSLLLLPFAPTPAAHAADGDANWTVRTASNQFGSDRTSYSYAIEPGSGVTDALVIANHGSEPLALGVYAADGYTTSSGQFDVQLGGATSRSIGAWVESDTDHVTVDPGQTMIVPFRVSVPDNATPGDYAGGILTSLVQPNATQQIDVDRRLGIRIALRVGGALTPSLAVEDPHLDWSGGLNPFGGGDSALSYTIHNTGNVSLSAHEAAALAGPFGMLPIEANKIASSPQLLPGESWKVSVPFRGIAGLIWLAATATVTPVVVDASGSTTTLDPVSATATSLAVPWMLLILVLVVAALVVLGVRWWRGRHRRLRAREDARVRDAVDLALAEAKGDQVLDQV